jgi:hypothetical protein
VIAFARPVLSRRGMLLDDRLEALETAPIEDPESVILNAAKRVRLLKHAGHG